MPASSIKVAIPGDASPTQITSAIAGEEALGTRFSASQVVTDGGEVVNQVTFDRLFALPLPTPPKVVLKASPAPGGMAEQWRGQMLVSGTIKDVVLYR